MKKIIFVLLFMFSMICMAEPSKSDIMNAISANNLPVAETMVNEVVSNHPKSATAHYYKSQVLAKENKVPEAKTELAVAMMLDPKSLFTDAEHLSKYEAVLNSAALVKSTTITSQTTASSSSNRHTAATSYRDRTDYSTIILGMLLLIALVLVIWVSIYLFSTRFHTEVVHSQQYYPSVRMEPESTPNTAYYTNRLYSNPNVHNSSVYVGNGGGTGGSSGGSVVGAAALGGVAGLATGLALGNIMGHNNPSGYYNGGSSRFGGGTDDWDRNNEVSSNSNSVTTTTERTTESYDTPSFSFDSGSGGSDSSWDSGSSSDSGSSDW